MAVLICNRNNLYLMPSLFLSLHIPKLYIMPQSSHHLDKRVVDDGFLAAHHSVCVGSGCTDFLCKPCLGDFSFNTFRFYVRAFLRNPLISSLIIQFSPSLLTSRRQSQHGSIAPDGCQIIGQSTENQSVRSRKHIHTHFNLKIAIFSTALVLGNRSMCLFLL